MNTTAILAVAAIGFAVSAVSRIFSDSLSAQAALWTDHSGHRPQLAQDKQALPPGRFMFLCHSHASVDG